MPDEEPLAAELAKSLETAIESLRWCKTHLDQRDVATKLQEIHIQLGWLAIALDHEMEGNSDRARAAVHQADWTRQAPPWGWGEDLDLANLH